MGPKKLHLLLAVGCGAVLLSGLLLYLPFLRDPLSEARLPLQTAHIVLGLVLVLITLANIPFFLDEQSARRISGHEWPAAFLLLSTVMALFTGVVLLLARETFIDVPYGVTQVHLVSALGVLLMGVVHIRRLREKTAAEPPRSRRDFLHRTAFLLALASGWLGWEWLKRLIDNRSGETTALFEDCNKLTPNPEPGPGSAPPKGGGYRGTFKVYTVTNIPCARSADWQFTVGGLVEKPLSFRWNEFVQIPRVVQVSDFHCVEGWSVRQVTYEGIRVAKLLDMAGAGSDARYVKFVSGDGAYTDALTLGQAREEDIMVALLIDGKPIPSDLGGPARLVVPRMWAYKAVKWLTSIEVIAQPHQGYWEVRGYPVDAWVRPPKS